MRAIFVVAILGVGLAGELLAQAPPKREPEADREADAGVPGVPEAEVLEEAAELERLIEDLRETRAKMAR